MWNPFRKKKQEQELTDAQIKDLQLHVAGSTVRHTHFDELEYFKNIEELQPDFIEKWVVPFYMVNLNKTEYLDKFKEISDQLSENIVKKLLGDFNWRTRIVGAIFSAIMNYKSFEEQIGTLLLKSEVTYAANGYVLALARFNSSKSVEYLRQYLDHYLNQKDLWFDQDDVMATLKWLDNQNGTTNHLDFLDNWNKFTSDKENWNLDKAYQRIQNEMSAIEELSELAKN